MNIFRLQSSLKDHINAISYSLIALIVISLLFGELVSIHSLHMLVLNCVKNTLSPGAANPYASGWTPFGLRSVRDLLIVYGNTEPRVLERLCLVVFRGGGRDLNDT